MEPPRIDAILFDLGGTLRRTTKRDDQGKRAHAEQILRRLGSDLPVEAFTRVLTERYQAYRRWAEQSLVELDEEHLWTKWLAPDYPVEKVRSLAPILNRLWREATGIRDVYPETIELIHALHRRGYSLGVVSNTISRSEIPLTLEAAGLADCFQVVLLSSVFGKRKPDPAILLAAAEALGVAPGGCAYIGNRVDRDVVGARRAGFALVIVVHHGHHSEKHPTDPAIQPDYTVHHLLDLLDYFPSKDKDAG